MQAAVNDIPHNFYFGDFPSDLPGEIKGKIGVIISLAV
jgi:hypothetical protein